MTFKEFLIKYSIPFEEFVGGEIAVDDYLIIPYELEFRKEVPEGELWWDYLRYRVEPNYSGNNPT
jgi:hypothetical protein